MFAFKKHYFLIIESVQDINLSQIKKRNKFTIIYRNLGQYEPKEQVTSFRKNCKAKDIKFFVTNDINLAQSLNADGIYLSARNNSLRFLKFKRKNFKIIGGAHNIREINHKKLQGCESILLSRLFRVSYKPRMDCLGVNKFNSYLARNPQIVALGGININNINKLKTVNSQSFAILSALKKKPAITSRLF